MAEKKISRKELLKEPDEFLTTTNQLILYIRENPGQAIAIVAVCILSVIIAVSLWSYKKHRETKSHELFLQASRNYEAVMQSDKEPTEDQISKLYQEFDSLYTEYGSLPAGEMALLYTGHILFKKKDFKEALARYLKMESSSLAKEGLRYLFWYHVAETRLALKEYDQAAELFEKLARDTDSPYRREAYVAIARIYELNNKTKEAVQAYRQYLKIFPEAPDAAFVKARIADLSVQG